MTRLALIAATVAVFAAANPPASAQSFVNSYTDGASFNAVYAQGFSPFTQPSPDPGLGLLDTVSLDRFQFFKSGLEGPGGAMFTEVPGQFQLAIIDNFFMNLDTLTVDSPELIGLSSNAINGSASVATGAALTFNFSNVELTYGIDYAALYVTNDGGVLTPVLVPTLIADYVETEPGSGVYVPESNYGDPDLEYQYSVSNFINSNEFGSFLASFNAPYADANFVAYYNEEPLQGDYNDDGMVDAADYTVYRDAFGSVTTLPNETVTPGEVTIEDHQAWAANYGGTIGAELAVAVPEPLGLAVTLLGLLGAATRGAGRS